MPTLRPYQTRAVDFCVPRSRAFVVAPAGSGKTYMAASAAAQKAERFDRIVWLANTREQCDQARQACAAMVWADPVVIDIHCVAARPVVAGAAIVIIDEAHHTPARTWWNTVCDANCVIWGFSATPWSGDWERDGVLKAFFGEENFITIPRDEVLAGGSLTQGMVVIHDCDDEGQFDAEIEAKTTVETEQRYRKMRFIPKHEHERRARWQFTADAVRDNQRRNELIAAVADFEAKMCRSVLILVSTIDHGEKIVAAVHGAQLVHAKLGKKKRTAAIEAFRSGELRVMVATSLADEGLDVPRAAVLILAAGGRSSGKLEQRAGRVMRPHDGKEFGVVHDFADRGASMAHNQFKARVRTYKRLGYTITTAAKWLDAA